MKLELVRNHIKDYLKHVQEDQAAHQKSIVGRQERVKYYQSWSADRLRNMNEDDLSIYIETVGYADLGEQTVRGG